MESRESMDEKDSKEGVRESINKSVVDLYKNEEDEWLSLIPLVKPPDEVKKETKDDYCEIEMDVETESSDEVKHSPYRPLLNEVRDQTPPPSQSDSTPGNESTALSFSTEVNLSSRQVKDHFSKWGRVMFLYSIRNQYVLYYASEAERDNALVKMLHVIGSAAVACMSGDLILKMNVNNISSPQTPQSNSHDKVGPFPMSFGSVHPPQQDSFTPSNHMNALYGKERFLNAGVEVTPLIVSGCSFGKDVDLRALNHFASTMLCTLMVNELSRSVDVAFVFHSGYQALVFLKIRKCHPLLAYASLSMTGKVFIHLRNCSLRRNALLNALELTLNALIVGYDEIDGGGFVRFHKWQDAARVLTMKSLNLSARDIVSFTSVNVRGGFRSIYTDWPFRRNDFTGRDHIAPMTSQLLHSTPVQSPSTIHVTPEVVREIKELPFYANSYSCETLPTDRMCYLMINFIPPSLVYNSTLMEQLKNLGVDKIQWLADHTYGGYTHMKVTMQFGKAVALLDESPLNILGHNLHVDIACAVLLKLKSVVSIDEIATATRLSYGPVFRLMNPPESQTVVIFHRVQDAFSLLKEGKLMMNGVWNEAFETQGHMNRAFQPFKSWIEKNWEKMNPLTSADRLSNGEIRGIQMDERRKRVEENEWGRGLKEERREREICHVIEKSPCQSVHETSRKRKMDEKSALEAVWVNKLKEVERRWEEEFKELKVEKGEERRDVEWKKCIKDAIEWGKVMDEMKKEYEELEQKKKKMNCHSTGYGVQRASTPPSFHHILDLVHKEAIKSNVIVCSRSNCILPDRFPTRSPCELWKNEHVKKEKEWKESQ